MLARPRALHSALAEADIRRTMRLPPLDPAAPSVLVVDEGFIGSLHTALGLRLAGARVVLLGAVGGRASCRLDGFEAHTCVRPHEPGFTARIAAARAETGCDVVYPCTEPTMLALDGALDRVWPPLETELRSLIESKAAMSRFAAAHDAAIPAQRVLSPGDDLDAILRESALPLVLKTDRGRGGDGTRIARSIGAARDFARRALAARGAVIAQEYVAGPTFLVGGLFREGEPLGVYAGEKVRQQPPRTGPAILIRSLEEPRLIGPALAVFRALRWTGLASMDFIGHESGRFLFLELNPRPWGSIAAAADAGIELFRPLLDVMYGRAPAPAMCGRAGVDTRVLPLYLLHRDYRRSPRTLARLVSDLRSRQGLPFRDARLARHVLYRLWRVKRTWRAV